MMTKDNPTIRAVIRSLLHDDDDDQWRNVEPGDQSPLQSI